MDKKIVATPISPDQPEVPRLILWITGVCLIVGVLAILGSSFWPVVGPWLVGGGVVLLIVTFFVLLSYWRPSFDHQKRRDMRKLYGR